MQNTPARILTVTELNRLAREILEQQFPLLWLGGEISNFTRASSGHWYFSLKDAQCQVRCVMFRGRNALLGWLPQNGEQVELRALVSLYEARGEFQITVEFMQQAGLGRLFEALERLKQQLTREGLLDAARKRPLPVFPKQIGIISSTEAAALQDVLTTLKRRMPSIPVLIYPTPVQGRDAAAKIAETVARANRDARCDVLLLCRGGGSIEDLWAFNEEVLVRAVADSRIPLVSGVGHETDFTLVDFVADQRAPTPTAAAEMASPDRQHLLHQTLLLHRRLHHLIQQALAQRGQHLDFLAHRLQSPQHRLQLNRDRLTHLQFRMRKAMQSCYGLWARRLTSTAAQLDALNPDRILLRGYARVQNQQGDLVSDVAQIEVGQKLQIRFANGGAAVQVEQTIIPDVD